MVKRSPSWLLALSGSLSTAYGFNLYPLLPSDVMQTMLGISPQCLSALNTTLSCDSSLFQWTLNVDRIYWEEPDVTTLCTSGCTDDAKLWKAAVESACDDQYIRSGDRYVPADTLSGRFTDGLNVACAQSSTNQWCLLESYDWVGSDVVQVDCEATPADPWCINKAEPSANNSRISTLYDDELLCSECFIKMLRLRVNSDFLPNADFSDYLTDEIQDIEKVCNKESEPITTRAVPWYPELSEAPLIGITTTPTSTPAEPTSTACAGRTVDIVPDLQEALTCHEIAEKYSAGSGEVAVATKNEFCHTTDPICLPAKCTLFTVLEGETCEEIVNMMSKVNNVTVTTAQLATWNPNLLGACDSLASQHVCASPPGGAWDKPPDSEIPDDDDGPVRGGPGSTRTLPLTRNPDDVTSDKVQEGIASDCTQWILANSTVASCWKMANDGKISVSRLCELNPVLGKNGENCGNMVWLGYYYCVEDKTGGTPTTSPTKTPPTSTTPTGSPKPTQTQAGIDKDCNKFEEAQSGDSCYAIASRAGVELSSFYSWNTGLGSKGENCGTQIWPGYFYCVGVSGTKPPPTTTPTGPPKPTQTQAGIDKDCNKFEEAKSGDSCYAIATRAGVELSSFYSWNTGLGSKGENCGTQIWPGYFYCVGVSGTKPPPSTTSKGPSLPSQTHEGFPKDCKKYIEAKSGDYCYAMATDNGITPEKFYELNPVLGSKGENCGTKVWPGYFYCVGR